MTVARKIAVVARAPSSRYRAPFHDNDWEIWTCSPQSGPGYCDLPRWDRWYELHHLEHQNAENPGYRDWLAALGDKVWLREEHPLCPKAHIYPRTEVLERFQQGWNPSRSFNYFTNSVSLMLAHALVEGATHLGIYGVDMCQDSEYGHQKPSCEAILGYLAGAGVEVTVPVECDLLSAQRIYGLDDEAGWERKLITQEKELEEKLAKALNECQHCKKQSVGASAAIGELQTFVSQCNGQLSQELDVMIKNRLAVLEDHGSRHELLAKKADEEVKLFTGAIEAIRHQRTLI